MTEKLQIYKCDICGNIIQVLIEGDGMLVCCGQEMKHQDIQHDTDALGEKHNPKIEDRDGKRYVHVKTHPMLKEHYIQFIQARTKDMKKVKLEYFYPEEVPEMDVTEFGEDMYAVEYCNIHHLWGM